MFLVLTPTQDCKGSYTFRRMAMLGVDSSVKVVLSMSINHQSTPKILFNIKS